MRHSLLVLLSLSLLTFNLSAQITSVKESAVTQSELGQAWQEVIENHSFSSIVAPHTTFECPIKSKSGQTVNEGRASLQRDIVAESYSLGAIPSNVAVEVPAQDPSKCSGGVDAVIFSDGHSEGDPDAVNAMYQKRLGYYKGLTEVLKLLDTMRTRDRIQRTLPTRSMVA